MCLVHVAARTLRISVDGHKQLVLLCHGDWFVAIVLFFILLLPSDILPSPQLFSLVSKSAYENEPLDLYAQAS